MECKVKGNIVLFCRKCFNVMVTVYFSGMSDKLGVLMKCFWRDPYWISPS